MKSYVSRKAERDPLMAKCRSFIATWKKPDKAAVWYEKPLHGPWHKGVSEVTYMVILYQWLNKSNITANTEALIMAAQSQALNTSAVAHGIYRTVQDSICRLCKQHAEPFIIFNGNLEHNKDWRVNPEKLVRNNNSKILWAFLI